MHLRILNNGGLMNPWEQVFMAQILVPFFRRYVDKDKVSDTETADAEATDAGRPASNACQVEQNVAEPARPLSRTGPTDSGPDVVIGTSANRKVG